VGAIKRHVRRYWRKKVVRPARGALKGLVQHWCADCERTVEPFHTCAPRSDFKQRRSRLERDARRRNRGRSRASGKPRERQVHDYTACRDDKCPRAACRAFREGQQACRYPTSYDYFCRSSLL